MPSFYYQAYDQSGRKITGYIEAADQALAQQQLSKQQLFISEITPKTEQQSFGVLQWDKGLQPRDIEFFTSEVTLLLQSGVKFDKAVMMLAKAKQQEALGKVLTQISDKLKAGISIHTAFAEHPQLFDGLYVSLLKMGEESGALTEVLAGLASDLKFRNDLRQTIIQAVSYPIIILVVCLLSIGFIFNFIVPKMAVLFDDVTALPLHTQIILSLSDWLIQYQLWLVGAIALMIGLATYYREHPEWQQKRQQWAQQLPWLKTLINHSERIRFCSSMALLLNNGVAMDQAVKLSANNARHQGIRQELLKVADGIRQGQQLSGAMRPLLFFPDMYVALVEIGEESGEVARIFTDLAARSQNEFTQWVNQFTRLLEPLLIISMGIIVGGVVVTMMLSVMSVNEFAL